MTEKETKKDEWADMNENRGGKKDGSTPDYEKNQSLPEEDKNFDNSKTSW